ncbi:hypothetical protein TURU_119226 [Turdus rufiventris]|nr:hypothetical protein TURU_119226 [Turdus rufiventris]
MAFHGQVLVRSVYNLTNLCKIFSNSVVIECQKRDNGKDRKMPDNSALIRIGNGIPKSPKGYVFSSPYFIVKLSIKEEMANIPISAMKEDMHCGVRKAVLQLGIITFENCDDCVNAGATIVTQIWSHGEKEERVPRWNHTSAKCSRTILSLDWLVLLCLLHQGQRWLFGYQGSLLNHIQLPIDQKPQMSL